MIGQGVIEDDIDYLPPGAEANLGPFASKWNKKFVRELINDKKNMLNRQISHLVTPHNLAYDESIIKANKVNKSRTISEV